VLYDRTVDLSRPEQEFLLQATVTGCCVENGSLNGHVELRHHKELIVVHKQQTARELCLLSYDLMSMFFQQLELV
jgi:hypothetical protein